MQRRHQFGVEQAAIHHRDHFERAVVGDAAPGDHHRLEPEPPRQRRGLRAAAVHHDQPDRQRSQQRELLGHLVELVPVGQHLAAELDDEDLVAIGAHVAQRALEPGDSLGRVDRQAGLLPIKFQQQCPLHVQAILRLVHHGALRSVQHRTVDLDVAAHRQAVHRDPVPPAVRRIRSAVSRQSRLPSRHAARRRDCRNAAATPTPWRRRRLRRRSRRRDRRSSRSVPPRCAASVRIAP